MSPAPTLDRPGRAPARAAAGPLRAGHAFVAGYVILLAAFGVVPAAYGIYFAFTNAANYFAGLSNFTAAARDFRYLPAVEHIAVYLVIWLVALVVLVTGLALVLHQLPVRRLSRLVRFLYYIPGALAGAASVLVWLFMLDPTVSPAASFLRLLGYGTFGQVIAAGPPVDPVRDDRVLDRCGRLDRGDVRGAEQHPAATSSRPRASTGPGGGTSPGASRSRCCASGSCTW